MRIPARRTTLHREKYVNVEASAAAGVERCDLGGLRATYAVRIPVFLSRLIRRWEEWRIERAEERSEILIQKRLGAL